MTTSNPLTELANQYGSDKGDQAANHHNYTRIYHHFFEKMRNRPVELCEIGLLHPESKKTPSGSYDRAPSLFMWLDYFPAGRVTGFDIDDFSSIQRDRLRIVRGDQSNREDLTRLVPPEGGLYDIIIDDGSHASHHQQISLGYLFKFVKPGGIYVIEDLAWQPPELEPQGAATTLTVLDVFRFTQKAHSPYFLPEEKRYLETNIEAVRFWDSCYTVDRTDSLALIFKK